jgi:hypothetical protein
MTGDAAAAAVDVHPAARRDLFDDRYGLQASVDALDVLASPFPETGFGFSRLVVDIWVVSCEMQRDVNSPTPPGNP